MLKNLFISFLFLPLVASAQDLQPFYCEFSKSYYGEYSQFNRKTTKLLETTNLCKYKFVLDCSWNGAMYVFDKQGVCTDFEFKIIQADSVTLQPNWIEWKCVTEDGCLLFFRYYHGDLYEITFFYIPNNRTDYIYLKGVSHYLVRL